jgi:hypothetical protein
MLPEVNITTTDKAKFIQSENYNSIFRYEDGYFMRWGKTPKDDPESCPFGPELADLEISEICHQGCKNCYKSNTSTGKNMSFETFKEIFHKLPLTCGQIAFGAGDLSKTYYFRKKK